MKTASVVIVGGGVSGLSAAFELQQRYPGCQVTLLESRSRLGGKIVTERVGDFLVEGAPDSFLSRKGPGIALVRALGLEAQLQGRRGAKRGSFVKWGGRLEPLPEGLTGLVPTDMTALTRSRLLTSAGVAAVRAEWERPAQSGTEDETVAAFIIRRFGREAYDRLIEPLLGGIYGGRADLLSLAATFPRLREIERSQGSVLRGLANGPAPAERALPPFVSLAGGMGTMITALEERLSHVSIRLETAAAAINYDGRRYNVSVRGRSIAPYNLAADALILATPAPAAARLLTTVDPSLARPLGQIPYSSTAVVTFAFRAEDFPRPLDGYGYVIPRAAGGEVMACSWSSEKWDGRAPQGTQLLRLFVGRYGDQILKRSSDAIIALARGELGETLGVTATPLWQRIHRWPAAMPQYQLGHGDRLAVIERALTRQPGLALCGAYFRGVGVPDCIESGRAAARAVAHFVTTSHIRTTPAGGK